MKQIEPRLAGHDNNIIITHPDSNYYFIPIVKNASSQAYAFLNHYGWKYYEYENTEEIKNKIPFTILREPVERWCSGFAQDFHRDVSALEYRTRLDNIFNNKLGSTMHTRKQSFYLENYDLDKIHFLKHGATLSRSLVRFTKEIMKLRIFSPMQNEKSVMDYAVKDKIKKVLEENPKYLELLKDYLRKDLEIYNNVNFYNG